jgi:methyl-accepting chemotaxis protein
VKKLTAMGLFSVDLKTRIALMILVVALLTIVAASVPLLFALAKEDYQFITLEAVKKVFLFGTLSLAVTIPFASWLVKRELVNPLQEIQITARKVADGNLEVWKTNSALPEISELSGSIQNIAAHLKTVLKNMLSTNKTLSMMAEAISTNSGKMTRGTKQEAAAMDTAYSSLEEMNRAIEEVTKNIDSLTARSEETSSSILEINASTEEVANSSNLLSQSVEETSSSIFEMTASIKQIAESVEALSESSEGLVSTIAEIDMSIREVASHAKESVRIAEEVTVNSAQHGMTSVEDTIYGMGQIQDAVDQSAAIVSKLYDRSEDIGRILTVINEVSEQTELLSLNASILAAQAGENGKGFAVVANEIKALAERTATSTKEITRIIKAVQRESKEAVESIQRGKIKAEQGKEISQKSGEALKEILDSTKTASEMARKIELSTVEQSKGVSLVRKGMDSIKTMIDQIHEAISNQKSGSERIQSATEMISDLSRQLKTAMAEQSHGGRQIDQAMEKILRGAQEIQKAVNEQKNGSRMIMKSIDNIRRSTQDKVGISSELNSSIRSLQEEQQHLKEIAANFTTG